MKRPAIERLIELIKARGDMELESVPKRPGYVKLWNVPRFKNRQGTELPIYTAKPATLLRLINGKKQRAVLTGKVRKVADRIAAEGKAG
jgi:hypothetical protein